MKLGWLSDIHLNFLNDRGLDRFLRTLSLTPVDGWLISGDIGEAGSIKGYLENVSNSLERPVYFVLGNHDFYGGSLHGTTKSVRSLVGRNRSLTWLTWSGVQDLGQSVALVGDDGWGDGRLGRPLETPVLLNDFFLIEELKGLSRPELVEKLEVLGDQAAERLKPKLLAAAVDYDKVVVATHVAPFREAAWHEGQLSNDDWVPWFSCQAVGDLLLDCAADHPAVEFLVVCGHTHSPGVCQPCANLRVLTAGAEYGSPRIEKILEL